MRFDTQAVARLERLYAEFFADVGQEAVRIARRADLNTVDESHVIAASAKVGFGGSRSNDGVASVANTLGGLFGGAGLASVYAINFSGGVHTPLENIVAVILCVVGAILLTVGTTLTLVRRN